MTEAKWGRGGKDYWDMFEGATQTRRLGYGQLGDPDPRQALQFSDHKGVWVDLNL